MALAVPAAALTGAAEERVDDAAAREVLSGPRVFALRLDAGPGLRGVFAYGDARVVLRDPVRVELVRIDERGEPAGALLLEPCRERVRADHVERIWRSGALRVHERVLVMDGDALVSELALSNGCSEPLELELLVSGGATPRLDRSRSRQMPIALPIGLRADPGAAGPGAPPAGLLELDGVPFVIAPLPAGERRDPGIGSETHLPLPSTRPAIATLHALLARGAPEAGGGPACVVTLGLDDGSAEHLPVPAAVALSSAPGAGETAQLDADLPAAARGRVEWRAVALSGLEAPGLLLAYTPPPGRFLTELALEGRGGRGRAALLAATIETPPAEGRLTVLMGETALGGMPATVALAATGAIPLVTGGQERALARRIALAPGETVRVVVAAAAGSRSFQTALVAMSLAEDGLEESPPSARHAAGRARWLADHLPRFTCSDPALEQAWHRAARELVRDRRELALPDFSLPVLYGGTCCAAHARVSPLEATIALRDLRWLAGDHTAQGTLRALLKHQRPDGLLAPVSPERQSAPEPHALAAAALDVFAVTGSEQLLREVLPLLEHDLEARLARPPAADGGAEGALLRASARALFEGYWAIGEPRPAAVAAARAGELDAWDATPPYLEAARRALAERADAGCGALAARGALDGLIRDVAGLVPRSDGGLELDPRVLELEGFRFTGLPHRGRRVDVTWVRPGAARGPMAEGFPEGLTVEIDGVRVHQGPRLERLLLP